jgi:hypothetical protein
VTSQRRQPKAIATTLHLERRNVLVLLVAGGLAMAAARGLADMAGYSRLVDAVLQLTGWVFRYTHPAVGTLDALPPTRWPHVPQVPRLHKYWPGQGAYA